MCPYERMKCNNGANLDFPFQTFQSREVPTQWPRCTWGIWEPSPFFPPKGNYKATFSKRPSKEFQNNATQSFPRKVENFPSREFCAFLLIFEGKKNVFLSDARDIFIHKSQLTNFPSTQNTSKLIKADVYIQHLRDTCDEWLGEHKVLQSQLRIILNCTSPEPLSHLPTAPWHPHFLTSGKGELFEREREREEW